MAEASVDNMPASKCTRFLAWLRGPSAAIYATYFLSSWGDRMWHFAVGLYLVFFDGNALRLAAVYGFICSGCVLLFGGVIGNWVDINRRLKVVRVALFVQNLSVALSAAGIAVLLVLHDSVQGWAYHVLEAVVIFLSLVAVLASVAYKIAIEKDWIVVVASGDSDQLANLNATTRSIDLMSKALSPMLVGQVMTYGSRLLGAIFIAGWNLFSVVVEYLLLLRVYRLVPNLAHKEGIDTPAASGHANGNASAEEKNGHVERETLMNSSNANGSGKVTSTEESEPAEDHSLQEPEKTPGSGRTGYLRLVFTPCIRLVTGWSVYMRQQVLLAGLALACLYMTVLGFDSITIGYIFSQGVTESVLGFCCAMAAVTGIIGTFLYTKLQKSLGLKATGIISFAAEVACLMFSLVSIWTPGSPFYLYNPTAQNCSIAAAQPFMNSTVADQYLFGNVSESRYRRDVGYSLAMYADYQFGQEDVNLLRFGHRRGNIQSDDISSLHRVIRAVSQNATTTDVDKVPYTLTDNGTVSAKDDPCNPANLPKTSVILFLIGIITSRIGLWMADLTVTQLYQENVIETERGVVGGVQNSLNMLLNMLKFVAVILLPDIHTFGYLTIMSFTFIALGLVSFTAHVVRATRGGKEKQAGDVGNVPLKNIIYKPRQNDVAA